MKKTTILLTVLTILACKQSPKSEEKEPQVTMQGKMDQHAFPEALSKVFDAHGGLEPWKKQRTLSYVLPNPELPETHTIDLWSRKDRVDTDQFSLGFDGVQVWLLDSQKNYKGDAAFYHNLMFYFHAMPFVLADDGIVYTAAEDLEFEGKSYPGLKIGYENGVGASSKDEYFIHYDPETHQMAWLGYTVTYMSGENSDNFRWIRYHDWQPVNGMLLPKAITWYNYEGRTLLDARDTLIFENVMLSKEPKTDGFYDKPQAADSVPLNKS